MKNRNEILYRKYLFYAVVLALATLFILTSVFPGSPGPVIAGDTEFVNFNSSDLPPKGNPKFDSALNKRIQEEYPSGPAPDGTTTENASASEMMTMEAVSGAGEETVRVIIEGKPGKVEDIASIVDSLGDAEGSYGDLVQAVIPVSQLTTLAEMQDIRFIRQPMEPLPAAITSEGVELINADDWQAASYNGTGVKIGILDVGFAGYSARQGEGELPVGITTWWAPSIGNQGTDVHGTACAEIVYDIAPAATYYFANFSTDVEYGNAVEWLISQGVDIISCSVGWPTGGPGDGTGFFCQVIDTARAAGILWAQAIGNQAQMHWQGDWSNPDSDVWHNFTEADEGNTISVSNLGTIIVALKWDDPWYSSGNDYDLLLYDSTGTLVDYSLTIQDGDDDPWELIVYQATYTGTYEVAIGTLGSPAPGNFHLYSYYQNLQYQTPTGSILVPADSFSSLTVGAVKYSTPDTLESFSSRGPTDDGRIKPDLVAPDGVSTATYGVRSFYGTSASTPHAAGAAALVKQRFPTYSPADIQDFLEGRAVDLDPVGKDNIFGSGLLDLGIASDNYTLTMVVSGSGNVTPSAGVHTYAEGTIVSVNATPTSGWGFVKWTGDVVNPSLATTNITMDTDKNISAYFSPIQISEQIVFTSKRGGNYGIYVMNIDGSNQTLLLGDARAYCRPEFSPDCSKIIYDIFHDNYGAYGIELINADGSGRALLTTESWDWAVSHCYYATWSPDGSKIAFATLQSYDRIYVMNSDGSNKDSVTSLYINDSNLNPSWSPDGRRIAFDSSLYSGDKDIYIINTDGSNRIKLANDPADDFEPAWSPDGTKIAFVSLRDGSPQIYVMNVNGSNVTKLTSNPSGARGPSWSPDGSKLTFWTQSDEDIYIINADGSNEIRISGDSTQDRFPSWGGIRIGHTLNIICNGSGTTSPFIGSYIYSANSTVNISAIPSPNWEFLNWTGDVADPDSANTTVIMDTGKTVTANFKRIGSVLRIIKDGSGSTNPPVSVQSYPIGATVNLTASAATNWAFLNWTGDVSDNASANTRITMDTDKTVTAHFIQTHVTLNMAVAGSGNVTPEIGDHTFPVGTSVNITATPSASWRFDRWEGDVDNAASPTTTVLMDSDKTVTAIFSTAMDKIVFTSWRYNGYPDVYTMNSDGSDQTRLTLNADVNDFMPAVSPDCRMIAFVSDMEDYDNEIYRMNIDGTGLVRLTYNPGWDTEPAWTLDGTRIAFTSDRDGTSKIYTMNLDGSDVTPVISGEGTKPAWSPDGTKIAFISSSGSGPSTSNVFIVDLNTGNVNRITNESPGFIYRVSWSPNPRIVYDSIAPPDPTPGVDQYYSRGLFIINADGSGKTMIPRNGALVDAAWPAWSPDGTKVVFATTRHPPIEIYTAKIDGTEVVQLTFENEEDSFPSWATYSPPEVHVPPTSGNGGGGGGGNTGTTSLSEYVTGEGKFVVDATAESADGLVKINIPKDTIGKDRNGNRLRFISIKKKDAPPPPDDCEFVSFTYDIGPNETTFDPAVYLTFTFSESRIPAGVAEENLVIGTWQNDKWVMLGGCIIDTAKNTVTAPISHFTYFTVMAYTTPASIAVTGLTVTPAEVFLDDIFNVSVDAINSGDLTDNFTVVLKVDDVVAQSKQVTLKGHESQLVTFSVSADMAGTHTVQIGDFSSIVTVRQSESQSEPAHFVISDLSINPDELEIGQQAAIAVIVTNEGEATGTYEVEFNVNGAIVATKEVTLAGGAEQQVSFNFIADAAGKKLLNINGIIGALVVKGEVTPQQQIPLPLEKPNGNPAAEPATEANQPTAQQQTSGINWVMISGIASGATVVAAGITYFIWRRKRTKQSTGEQPS